MKRFISRRRTSKLFIFDNFSTFKSRKVTDFLRHYDNLWEFILQNSPWQGGFYEKLTGITKMSLKKVVGKARLFYDEVVTVIYEIENSVNSRQLTYLIFIKHRYPHITLYMDGILMIEMNHWIKLKQTKLQQMLESNIYKLY